MSSLVLCADCRRHVRHHERQCPFCGAARTPAPRARRETALARDATRATLIALGLTMAGQACGGREDDGERRDNVGVIPPYGLVPRPEGGSGGSGGAGAGGGGRDAGGGGDAGGGQDGKGGDDPIVPPYGAMPPPDPGGGAGGDGGDGPDTPDSGTPPDAGTDDAGDTPDAD